MSGLAGIALPVLAGAAAGYGAGIVHFRSLRRVVDGLLAGRPGAVVLQVARLAILVAVLLMLALWSPWALLSAAAGATLARARVLARERTRG